VTFMEVGAAELCNVDNSGGEVVGPTLVPPKVAEHCHRLFAFI